MNRVPRTRIAAAHVRFDPRRPDASDASLASPSGSVSDRSQAIAFADAPRIVTRSAQFLVASILSAFVFARHAVAGVLSRKDAAIADALGKTAVFFCSRLGATFIKVGQIASTRIDLLPAAFALRLAQLQDQVPAFSFESAKEIVESEFGQPLEAIFEDFDPVPIAAASVAQVHRGTLRENGARVAVKIRRPDIAEKVRLDRAILVSVAGVAQRLVGTLRLLALEEAVMTFCDAVEGQLDLSTEAANNRRFQANFADDPDVCFPRLYDRYCSSAVLTMEFVEGVHERDIETEGIDIPSVVQAGMRAVCRMIFLHAFVHADLHPGNLLFAKPGKILVLDLGLVGILEEEDRLTTAKLLFALATGDGVTVARVFFDNAPHTATPDYAVYEAEICALVDDVRNKGLANLQLTAEILRIFDTLRRHRVQTRAHMTMVNLALMTAEGLGRRLAPDFDLTKEALPFLAEALGVKVPDMN